MVGQYAFSQGDLFNFYTAADYGYGKELSFSGVSSDPIDPSSEGQICKKVALRETENFGNIGVNSINRLNSETLKMPAAKQRKVAIVGSRSVGMSLVLLCLGFS